jgi:hypothetical protein
MIFAKWKSIKLLSNIPFGYFKFKYKFYDGFKSSVYNNIVNVASIPIDILHLSFGFASNLIFIILPQLALHLILLISDIVFLIMYFTLKTAFDDNDD